ncbi:MAG TPA: SUMF1/EgtB/PvdO family nonheme iron enzyme [Sphingobacteriaceae bacterium]|nr:SUMF1/EgtB/PvdO family nonheme iron enzyme [Sphingobacteriaceae bacterium]
MLRVLFFYLVIISFFETGYAQPLNNPNYTDSIPGTSVKFSMVKIPGGTFFMGSPQNEAGRDEDEGPRKQIKIDSFWMGAHEVTYDEYEVFMNDGAEQELDAITRPTPPYIDFTLGMGKQGGYPANSMSQYGALYYCYWLYKKTGEFYRLPTEAEWEYASRAGKDTSHINGISEKQLAEYAWMASNSENKYHKVGLLKANAWGLYDMAGNVQEWTLDQYLPDYFVKIGNDPINPAIKPESKHPRTLKGGSYLDNSTSFRSANRIKSDLAWNVRDPQIPRSKWWNADAPFVGFRLVKPKKKITSEEVEKFFSDHMIK